MRRLMQLGPVGSNGLGDESWLGDGFSATKSAANGACKARTRIAHGPGMEGSEAAGGHPLCSDPHSCSPLQPCVR